MKKISILCMFLIVAILLGTFYFASPSLENKTNSDIGGIKNEIKDRIIKEKEYLIDPPPPLKHQRKTPSFDMPIEEYYRIEAKKKKEKAFKIKENLEWLERDVEIDYVNYEEKMVAPFDIVNEKEVGWDIQSLDIIDRYNIGSIKNYIPVQFKVEQMAKGGFKNKIKSLEVFSPSGKKQKFYSKEYQIKVEPSDEGINIFYFGSDGPYGAFTLYGGTDRGFSGYIDHVDLGGRHLIELNSEGKGYVYNIYK